MNCDEAKREMVLVLGGIDDRDVQERLERHATECADCAGKLEKALAIGAVRGSLTPGGEPDWEISWRAIRAGSIEKVLLKSPRILRRRWAAVGAVAIVFVLGAIAGRLLLKKPMPAVAPQDLFAGMTPEAAWSAYADRLEILLIDVGNRKEAERPKDLVLLERAMVEHILAETRFLKSLLAGAGEDVRLSLLSEAEVLLAKIASFKFGEKSSGRDASRLIRESALRAKLDSILDPEPILLERVP